MPNTRGFVHRCATYIGLATVIAACGAHDARAQDLQTASLLPSVSVSTTSSATVPAYIAQPPLDLFVIPEQPATDPVVAAARPKALLPLYVSFASLQVFDIASTRYALDHGAQEANPVLAGLADSTPALVAVKAGSTAAIIYLTERLRKRHPVAAVLLMVGLNAGYASIVAHNYSVGAR